MYNKAIEREVSKFQQTLDSIPGIGPIFTSGIIAENWQYIEFY